MDRRSFVFASSGAAVGTLIVPGLASEDESGLSTGQPKPLRHREVPGFLSAAQIAPHHTAHYGGALQAFVTVEQALERGFAGGPPVDPLAFERMKSLQSSRGIGLRDAITKRFGSVDRWAVDFVAW